MSSIFKDKGIYYLQVTYSYKSKKRSLRTGDYRIAKQRAKKEEPKLYEELANPTHTQFLPFRDLIDVFLKADHKWSVRSRETYEWLLNSYKKNKCIPKNKATKVAMLTRINTVINWGIEHGFVTNMNKFKNVGKMPARIRVFTDAEMILIHGSIKDKEFNRLVRMAYYTGARRAELLHINPLSVVEINRQWCIGVKGKSGVRMISLNRQAMKVLTEQGKAWEYELGYITKHFKKNIRKLGIKDGRFHDLRRTFGFNLIRRGMPIYEVSKLLGHKSVATTERHYAPLIPSDVGEFSL